MRIERTRGHPELPLSLNPIKLSSWTPKPEPSSAQAMREIGRKAGKIGGKRSLETMTPEERSARAKKAAAAKKRTAARLARERGVKGGVARPKEASTTTVAGRKAKGTPKKP
jgi:hypothetical protein